ncbi:hypothetical protein [Streptomyces sp. NBC_00691]|uniref:hypothetical protein n=1 Tax=Streptomyces sp. NBC_00691 TaxID=2903671 RepID=UPI002E2EBD49|nr:hypothetical protein [Streptomyces sp. NBC_00691]
MTVDSLSDLDVTDHYTEALHEVIEAKAEHRAPRAAEGEGKAAARSSILWPHWSSPSPRHVNAAAMLPSAGGEATVHKMPAKPKKKTLRRKTAWPADRVMEAFGASLETDEQAMTGDYPDAGEPRLRLLTASEARDAGRCVWLLETLDLAPRGQAATSPRAWPDGLPRTRRHGAAKCQSRMPRSESGRQT